MRHGTAGRLAAFGGLFEHSPTPGGLGHPFPVAAMCLLAVRIQVDPSGLAGVDGHADG
jgi:hypothetical protein